MKIFRPCFLIILVIVIAGCNGFNRNHDYPEGSIAYPSRAVTQRASSYDPDWENGNDDNRIIQPGQSLEVANLSGPGQITHIWFTAHGAERGYPRSVILRIYWDGQEEPAVEAPLGDFFAAGHGMQVDVTSSLVATSSHGRAYNCYWPMPFRKSARITISNDSEKDPVKLYWYIEWEKRKIPRDVPCFHARYRQEYPVHPGEDYLIADIEGKGHYVGTVLSVRASQPEWFGEGDDRFYIDGDSIPTLHGTGTEDYFNDAWGYRVLNRPYYGISIWEGMNTGSRITTYRWHVTDPIFFDRSLRFAIEHKGITFDSENKNTGYGDGRPDLYSSVAFWYQLGAAKATGEIPPVAERVVPFQLIQAEETLDVDLLPHTDLHESIAYTNGKGVEFKPVRTGECLSIPFEIPKQGNYLVFIRIWPDAHQGIYEFRMDGQSYYKGEELFRDYHFATDIKLGNDHRLEQGTHHIEVVYHGTSDPRAKGNLFIDAIVIEPV